MAQYFIRMLVGNMAGQSAAAFPIPKAEQEEPGENAAADISGVPDIMDKIMDWSEN